MFGSNSDEEEMPDNGIHTFSFATKEKRTLQSIDGVPVEGCKREGEKFKCDLANGNQVDITPHEIEEALKAMERD